MNILSKAKLCVALLISSVSIYAQTPQDSLKSMVVLNEEDLISLTKTLKKYKKEKQVIASPKVEEFNTKTESSIEVEFLKQQILLLEDKLNTLKTSQKKSSEPKKSSLSVAEYELRILQLEIAELKGMMNQFTNTNSTDSKPTVISIPAKKTVEKTSTKIETPLTNNSINLTLAKKIDSLNSILKTIENKKETNYATDFENLQNSLQNLKNELTVKKVETTNSKSKAINYKDYSTQLYFDNNSKTIIETQLKLVDELVEIMRANPTLDIYIKGFASKTGNLKYNENLSLLRTEAVKKLLISKGLHPTRILSSYHGVDYSALTDHQARRVAIEFLVR